MTDNRFQDLNSVELRTVDRICIEFESVEEPGLDVIEQFVAEAATEIRGVLFGELLALDLELKGRGGSIPTPDPYLVRFPERREQINSIFSRLTAEQLELPASSPSVMPDSEADVPPTIGRFRIEEQIGEGGFGIVYRGYDGRLDRSVAIKVPRPRFIAQTANLTEAKAVARVDHPNIVPVFELGHSQDHPFFLVTKFIDGSSLAEMQSSKQPGNPLEAAKLVATIAEALQHVHEQGFVHRDVKPGNILIDRQGQPHLADFGLVLPEEDIGSDSDYGGTPAYMSPEQAGGEGHHVDGRSDIFSLGVVFYELLSGRRPFGGKSKRQIIQNIMTNRPRPLRQYDGQLPPELDRICMKALSRRISDRYATARDMADDLHNFLALSSSSRMAAVGTALFDSATPGSSDSHAASSLAAHDSEIFVTPRGLCAFDSRDKDFFLRLLPGPYNWDGLPESVGFWKTQIEELDPEKTFSVGLIYGPSGSGKSSLVKAGLLPQLCDDVSTIYIEATGDGTEDKLQQQLRMKYGDRVDGLELGPSIAAIRRDPLMSGHKLLIVIDQFEQWLHIDHFSNNNRLLEALRHCDGPHVQCLLMVRDEFWLSISRLMQELGVDLVTRHNIALVDLFDEDHARKVLWEFGRSFGKLPRNIQEMTVKQAGFLDRIIGGLSQGGKIVPVRLAMMAEMLAGKPWTSEILKAIGGPEGVGVAFLNETFDTRGSNPAYRIHRDATHRVLKSLLPETGSDLKGNMLSRDELLSISGYRDQPDQFEQLIRILGTELRLITPTETVDSQSGKNSALPSRSNGFVLTHDYLVHSVRNWITQHQRQSRRGRAEMRLESRALEWQFQRSGRYLPSAWDYANIRLFTRKSQWTTTQKQMMARAGKHHGFRWGSGLAITFLVATSLLFYLNRIQLRHQTEQIESAVATLRNSRGALMPRAIDDLDQFPRQLVISKLRERLKVIEPDQRLLLLIPLAAFDGLTDPQILIDEIDFTPNYDVPNLIAALNHTKPESLKLLRREFEELGHDAGLKRAKIAILALYLGDVTPAKTMCGRAADPIQRTWFIEQHASWHGRISELVQIAKDIDDPDLQSGLCLAVGSTEFDPIFPRERQAWRSLATAWYLDSPDSGVHSAAGWMLRRWKMTLPDVAVTPELTEDRNWHVTPSGITMVKIPAGSFLNRIKGDWTPFAEDAPSQKITVSRDFLISDREVSLGQFREAMEDPDVDLRERPYLRYDEDDDTQAEMFRTRWDKVFEYLYFSNLRYSEEHPVTTVSWIQAVMYCNWLSRKEGLQPCYERTGKIHLFPYYESWLSEDWRFIPGRNGYRLPTNAEWELACRASTTTDYCFGNDTEFLSRYAVHEQKQPEPCGSKLPNGWGLFDMHGNVAEFCNDWVRSFRCDTQSKTDPMGPDVPVYLPPNYPNNSPTGDGASLYWRKIRCGGRFDDAAINKASYLHSEIPIFSELPDTGFRVVRNLE